MSRWCHVIGAIKVETFKKELDICKYIEQEIKDAPKITGSEGNCQVDVIALEGYNLSVFYNGVCTKFQSCATINIYGDLRDKGGAETKKEIEDFLHFISHKKIMIEYVSINIYDELDGIYNLYIQDTWAKKPKIKWVKPILIKENFYIPFSEGKIDRDNNDVRENFKNNFNSLLKIRHITLAKFARDLDIRISTPSDWKTGKNFPQPKNLERIAKYFNVNPEDLISERRED